MFCVGRATVHCFSKLNIIERTSTSELAYFEPTAINNLRTSANHYDGKLLLCLCVCFVFVQKGKRCRQNWGKNSSYIDELELHLLADRGQQINC